MSRPAVFLDRDGVITQPVVTRSGERAPWTDAEVSFMSHAREAVQRLRSSGLLVVVVTNQPDVARDNITRAQADQINRRVDEEIGTDAIFMCPHDNSDSCGCRKPRPGLLFEAAETFSIDLARSWMVGDRWSDIAAGRAAGVKTVLVHSASSWKPTSAGAPAPDLQPDLCAADLAEAANLILGDGTP